MARWSIESLGLTPIDNGLKSVSLTYSDWSEVASLSQEERTAIADARMGKRETKLTRAQQRGLIRRAKIAEAAAKKAKKDAKNKKK